MNNTYTQNCITAFKSLYGKVYKTSKPCENTSNELNRKTMNPMGRRSYGHETHTGLKGD